MGSTVAAGMAEMVEEGQVSLRQAVAYHLECNHFPPVPEEMVPVCLRVIRHLSAGDDAAGLVRLPKGVTHRQYGRDVPAWVIADELHLEAFIEEED